MSLRQQNPIRIFLIISGGQAFFNALIFTINLIYQAETVGLNPLQLVLVGTTLELTAFLFEVPTGIVADVYSRRLSVIIGTALVGCGFLLEGSIPLFWTVLGAQVLWGIGYTFTSGALQAWLAAEIDNEEAIGAVFLRASQVRHVAGFVGIGVSVWLAQTWLQLPIILGGSLYLVLAIYLLLAMPEEGFVPTPSKERETWKQMAATARRGVHTLRGHQVLLILMGLSLVSGLYSEGYDRLWTPHLLDNFRFPVLFGLSSVVWFGIIQAGSSVLGIAANELAHHLRATAEDIRTVNGLTLLYGLLLASLLLLAWAGNFWLALLALWVISLSRSTIGPLEEAWIVRNTENQQRATIISLWGQMNAIGQVAGGPFVGWVGTIARLPLALTISCVLLMPSQWLLVLARKCKPT